MSTTACCARARAISDEVYKDSFDYLYDAEPMGLVHLAIHSHFGGRPLIAAQFEKLLRYFSGFPDVWILRHAELAEWFIGAGAGDLSFPSPSVLGVSLP